MGNDGAQESHQGKSIVPFLREDDAEPNHQYVFGIHTNVGIEQGSAYPIRSISNGKWKLIVNANHKFQNRNLWVDVPWMHDWLFGRKPGEQKSYWSRFYLCRPETELYNLQTDPRELNNLIFVETLAPTAKRLRAVLRRWTKQQNDLWMETEMSAVAMSDKGEYEQVPCADFTTRLITTSTSTTAANVKSQTITSQGLRGFKMARHHNRDLRCVLQSAPSRAGCKTRLEIK